MNLILLHPQDFIDKFHVQLSDRRHLHLRNIIKPKIGDTLTLGLLNGKTGSGRVTAIDDQSTIVKAHLTNNPPPKLPLTLIVGLTRPYMFKRILMSAAGIGVRKIIILNFSKIEKSLWQSSALRPQSIQEQLILGLEQAKDTVLPDVRLEQRFRPFVEDELSLISEGSRKLVADVNAPPLSVNRIAETTTLLIGPEGGLVPFERDLLIKKGFQAFSVGTRVLRVDTAVPYIIGKLF